MIIILHISLHSFINTDAYEGDLMEEYIFIQYKNKLLVDSSETFNRTFLKAF